jgi:hypothetical protein
VLKLPLLVQGRLQIATVAISLTCGVLHRSLEAPRGSSDGALI